MARLVNCKGDFDIFLMTFNHMIADSLRKNIDPLFGMLIEAPQLDS